MLNIDILNFVAHKWNCDALQPMWHKGPCDCGLYELFDRLRLVGLSRAVNNRNALTLVYSLYKVAPDLMADWAVSRKRGMPRELYLCNQCGNPTAEKQSDVQGWDGFCHCCGMIAQSQVGEPVFSVLDDDAKEVTSH